METNRLERWLPFVAALIAVAPPSFAGIVGYSDLPAFEQSVNIQLTEDFESAPAGTGLAAVDFSGAAYAVTTTDVRENRVVDLQDGYGALAHEGSQFWKLAGGTTTVAFGGESFNALGFFYSDLEAADVMITLHADVDEQYLLSGNNPNRTDFVGLVSDAAFGSFSLTWIGNQGDGVGFDAMMLGSTTPEPASMALACTGLMMLFRRRG